MSRPTRSLDRLKPGSHDLSRASRYTTTSYVFAARWRWRPGRPPRTHRSHDAGDSAGPRLRCGRGAALRRGNPVLEPRRGAHLRLAGGARPSGRSRTACCRPASPGRWWRSRRRWSATAPGKGAWCTAAATAGIVTVDSRWALDTSRGERVVLEINRDITARLQARKTRAARERQLRFVTDSAPVLIAHCDRSHRFKFVNRPYAARFGLQPSELIGRSIPDVLGAERLPDHPART